MYICKLSLLEETFWNADAIDTKYVRQRTSKSGSMNYLGPYMPCIVGQTCLSGEYRCDQDTKKPRIEFHFSDIAIRMSGLFRIRCFVVSLIT